MTAHIGPYAIADTVETGAFTVTYRATQPRIGRTVILKALKPTVSTSSAFAGELEREAAVLARLDHEGFVHLHDFVRTEGALYLVLEDLTGPTLEAVLRAAKQPVDQALGIGLGLARAVAHAHERGVVLGLLSPSSIVITPAGRVAITNLTAALGPGSARGEEGEPRTETPVAPSYIAPEQILGDVASARSDVWALGVILHEMLAGARPWSGEDERPAAARIRGDAPAPLPSAVPPAITRIVTRCLAKEAGDRYADGRALVAALEEATAEETALLLPLPVLATRALAAARLGEALPAPRGAAAKGARAARSGPDIGRAARSMAFVSALTITGGAAIRLVGASDEEAPGDGVAEATPAGPRDRGLLRVVARPWAEVLIDGQQVDTTPIGKPISVTPGKHFVTFRHPRAADEQRTIKIAAGQTVFLDVSMRIDRGDAGAPRGDAGPRTEPSP